jgi:hypothetical protein
MKLTLSGQEPYSVLMSHLRPALLLAVAVVGSGGARAAASADQSVWMTAISSKYVVVDLSTGDLDGDGAPETAACYREDVGRTAQQSGVVILKGKAPDQQVVWHAQLDNVLCEKVRISGKKVGVLLEGKQQLAWTYGDQIKFKKDKGGLYQTASVKASSQADPAHSADKAIDGDLVTSWAEGASGTGIGQTLTIHFAKPTDIAALGILAGSGASNRSFFDSNRIHRGSIEAKTEADLGDSSAGLDFSSLGIDSIGDRVEFLCENKPVVTYVQVDKKGVVELQIRIESVYLGDKRDETNIAEVDVVPLLSLSETVDRATAVKAKGETGPGAKGPDGQVNDGKEAVKNLDKDGRSVVPDDL